jgi:hypothetical protein
LRRRTRRSRRLPGPAPWRSHRRRPYPRRHVRPGPTALPATRSAAPSTPPASRQPRATSAAQARPAARARPNSSTGAAGGGPQATPGGDVVRQASGGRPHRPGCLLSGARGAGISGETTSTIPSGQSSRRRRHARCRRGRAATACRPSHRPLLRLPNSHLARRGCAALSGQQQQPMGPAADGYLAQPGLGELTIGLTALRSCRSGAIGAAARDRIRPRAGASAPAMRRAHRTRSTRPCSAPRDARFAMVKEASAEPQSGLSRFVHCTSVSGVR